MSQQEQGNPMEKRRAESRFEYAVLAAVMAVIFLIVWGMVRTEKPEVLTVLGGALTLTIGYVGTAAQHLWGQSKKQQERQQVAPQGSDPGAPAS